MGSASATFPSSTLCLTRSGDFRTKVHNPSSTSTASGSLSTAAYQATVPSAPVTGKSFSLSSDATVSSKPFSCK